MSKRVQIDEFLAQKKLALLRASAASRVKGFSIDKELVKKGYTVLVLYLDDAAVESKLKDLQGSIGGVIIVVPPDQAEIAVSKAIDAKISRIWLQQGAESKAAVGLLEQPGISAIYGECVLMFAQPVKSAHAFHCWIWKVLGKLPK